MARGGQLAIDSLKYHLGPPYQDLLRPAGGQTPEMALRPFQGYFLGHPTPSAYARRPDHRLAWPGLDWTGPSSGLAWTAPSSGLDWTQPSSGLNWTQPSSGLAWTWSCFLVYLSLSWVNQNSSHPPTFLITSQPKCHVTSRDVTRRHATSRDQTT
jgi:hypothetical protein